MTPVGSIVRVQTSTRPKHFIDAITVNPLLENNVEDYNNNDYTTTFLRRDNRVKY